MLAPSFALNPVALSYLVDLADDERARQTAIVRARNYHEGRQFVRLTPRLREFLKDVPTANDSDLLRLNVCRTPSQAVLERLLVKGFTCDDAMFATDAWGWWQRHRMDAHQGEAHERTIVDGEAFVIVSWDNATSRPRFVPHPRYTDATVQTSDSLTGPAAGDGFGCKAFYIDDDMSQPMEYATKRWTQVYREHGKRKTRQRLTIYYPDKIEKYELNRLTAIEFKDTPDEPWPIPWIHKDGTPLGIPVIHFRNESDRCEAWDAIPLQNAINKCLIDLLIAGDATAFRILIALGFMPTTDGRPPNATGSNVMDIAPGKWVGSEKAPSDASVTVVDGADLTNMIAPIEKLIFWTAMVTDTPVSRFITTGNIAAEGTLKQQEGPLINKIRKRQSLIGNGWEDCLSLARRLSNTFGGTAYDEDTLISTVWEPAEVRDETEELNRLALKKEKLGIPLEYIWKEAGYSDDQIATMQRSPEYQARVALLGLSGMQGESEEG